jgi:hypothetical protein
MRPFIVQSQLRKVPGEKRKNYRSLKHLLTMCVGGQILVPLAIQRFEGGNHSPEGIPRSNHCIDIATLDVNVWVGELFPERKDFCSCQCQCRGQFTPKV